MKIPGHLLLCCYIGKVLKGKVRVCTMSCAGQRPCLQRGQSPILMGRVRSGMEGEGGTTALRASDATGAL